MERKRLYERLDAPLFVGLCIVAIPVILLRLFGLLFFAGTISNWAIVPAIALAGLLAASRASQAVRRACSIAFVLPYVFSVYFHGWGSLIARLAEGRDGVFEGMEAALILLLGLQSWTPRDRDGRAKVA